MYSGVLVDSLTLQEVVFSRLNMLPVSPKLQFIKIKLNFPDTRVVIDMLVI